jgi:hypothetical protein
VGFLAGGRPMGLANLHLAWAPLMLAGLLLQVALFSDAVAARVGDLGPLLYVGSTLLVVVAVVRNVRLAGMPIVAAGATCNLAAIVTNGGYMPASREALAAIHHGEAVVYSNSAVLAQPMLPWLTDIFALPRWLPWTNIFSVGDVLIAVGVAVVIVAAMRTPALPAGAPAH